jgi:hypothetical protein
VLLIDDGKPAKSNISSILAPDNCPAVAPGIGEVPVETFV